LNNTQAIATFQKTKFPWIVLFLLVMHTPAIPMSTETREDSAWFLIYKWAVTLGANAVGIAAWLHFFSLFFSDGDMNFYILAEEKEKLNTFFKSQAQAMESQNKEIHRLFFAFSTWNKEVLDTATGDFHPEQNIELLTS